MRKRPHYRFPTFPPPASPEKAREAQGWEGGGLLSITLILLSVGLATLYSASSYTAMHNGLAHWSMLLKQIEGVAIGVALMTVLSQVGYHRYRALAWPLLIVVAGALLLILLPGMGAIAPRINGARRWINIGVMTLQPSEFAKIALIIWAAHLTTRKGEKMDDFKRGLLPVLLVSGIVLGLIALEPSMSAALLAAILVLFTAYCGGARTRHFLLLGLLTLPILLKAIMGASYRLSRFEAFLDPEAHAGTTAYQVTQALTAIGSGGYFGRGFGQSQMKAGFLPEAHNDFTAAILGEEWGFTGLLVLIALYSAMAAIGYRIAKQAPDVFGTVLALGLSALLVLPAFFHLAINLSLMPPTGVPLPFISFGRSNLLVSFLAIAILLNIADAGRRRRAVRERLEEE